MNSIRAFHSVITSISRTGASNGFHRQQGEVGGVGVEVFLSILSWVGAWMEVGSRRIALALKAAVKLCLAELYCEIKDLLRARHKSVFQVEEGPKQFRASQVWGG